MAVGKKAAGAAKSAAPKGTVAMMRPDQMSSAGLANDFDGLITEVRLVPWNYPTEAKPEGSIDHHILAVRVAITPDEDSGFEPFTQHYSAGELEHFVPSMDGENPVDLESDDESEMEGVYALKVGKKDNLNNTSNWAHFLTALHDAGFPLEEMEADVRFLEGLYAHFNRVEQRKRSGITSQAGTSDRKREILVVTEVKERRDLSKAAKSAAKKGGASKSAAASKATDNGTEEMDNVLVAAIIKAAKAADENTLQKSKLSSIAIKAFAAGGDKTKAVKRVGEASFLEGLSEYGVIYDSEEATLIYIESEE